MRLISVFKTSTPPVPASSQLKSLTSHPNNPNPFVGLGEATVWKHYLDWDKNVFGPTAKKAQ